MVWLSNVRETSVQFDCSCRRQTAEIPRAGERSYDSIVRSLLSHTERWYDKNDNDPCLSRGR